MSSKIKEIDFIRELDILSRTRSKKTYEQRAKRLIEEALKRENAFYPFRLAMELDRRGYSTSELEDRLIVLSQGRGWGAKWSHRYLILFPLNVSRHNISKLQRAVIETNNTELMAEFASIQGADKNLLENLILKSNTAKSSYLFISLNSSDRINEHKKVLLKSKKSRYLYKCAQLAFSKKEFSKIEDLILKNRSIYYIRLIANHRFANHSKIENRIIETGNFEEIKRLYKITKSQNLAKYIIIM